MPQESYDATRLRDLVDGLSLILKTMQERGHTQELSGNACAFAFEHDVLYVGQPSLFTEETRAHLKELGFHAGSDEDHFYKFG